MKLTDKEASIIEVNKLENDILDRDITIKRLEVLVAELRSKIVIQESSAKIQELLQRKELLKKDRTQVIEPIKERLGIEGAFGFDPDTLEVITEDKEG